MRESCTPISFTKERVKRLVGVPCILKVTSGRGKSQLFHGEVVSVFPSVFTVQTESGEVRTFAYSDVHSGNVLFLKAD